MNLMRLPPNIITLFVELVTLNSAVSGHQASEPYYILNKKRT
ncbi:hypothetical protein Glo7428_2916 [Gloeocapsa sp. PCC 7428]|nr:hypothetical protein Glo7428_2916 [Gloeocapsa sp. PCC 7428]